MLNRRSKSFTTVSGLSVKVKRKEGAIVNGSYSLSLRLASEKNNESPQSDGLNRGDVALRLEAQRASIQDKRRAPESSRR